MVLGLRRNGIYNGLLTATRAAVTIAAIPVLIRTLGIEEYGVWTVLLSVVTLSAVAQLGLDSALHVRLAGAAEERRGPVAGTSLLLFSALGGACALLLAAAAPLVARGLFPGTVDAASLAPVLRIMGTVVLVQFWRGWASAVEVGLQRYDLQARAEGAGTILTYAGFVAVAGAGAGLRGLAWWLLAASVATLGLHLYLLRGRLPGLGRGWERGEASAMLRFGTVQWVSQVGGSLFGQVDRILVNLLLGPAGAGIYAAGTGIAAKINELSAAVIQPMVPALSMATAAGQPGRVRDVFVRAQRVNGMVVFLLASAVALGAGPIAEVLVTERHAGELAPLLRILALVYGLYSLNAPGFFAAIGLGRPRINAVVVLLAGVAFVALLSVMAPAMGLAGAAWANLGYALTLAINWRVARMIRLPFREYAAQLAPLLCSALLAGALTVLLARSPVPAWAGIALSAPLVLALAGWVGGRAAFGEAGAKLRPITTLLQIRHVS